jgi:UPF0755 protein
MSSYLGVDIGEKRIGVAVCDTMAAFPAPLVTLEANPNIASEFAEILKKQSVKAIVIGYPRNQNGEPTAQTARVEHIAKLLKIPVEIPVYWQDESLTSVKAEEELKHRKKPFSKGDVDALAATFILEDFIKTQLPTLKHQASNISPIASQPNPKVKKKPARKRKHHLLYAVIGIGLALVAVVVGTMLWYLQAISAKTSEQNFQVITVKPGTGTQLIASDLEQKGLIRSSTAFTIFVRLKHVNNLQAGSYRLSSNQSVADIVDVIANGKITTVNVLISPGLRLDQILTALEKDGYSKKDLDQALNNVRDHLLLKNLSKSTRLEGYLFPDTYKVGPDTSSEQLIRLMLDNFQNKITPQILEGIQKQGLTFEQSVILASIVQKEVSDPKVQRTVAQVFIKRLHEGTVLGSDVTYKYAAAQFGTEDTPMSSSPYNTRRYSGLPPTAISNFNISALQAVANPTATDYNFFVAGDDGTTYFSHTEQQHQEYIKKYCIKGCQ